MIVLAKSSETMLILPISADILFFKVFLSFLEFRNAFSASQLTYCLPRSYVDCIYHVQKISFVSWSCLKLRILAKFSYTVSVMTKSYLK